MSDYSRLTKRDADGNLWTKCKECAIYDECDFSYDVCCVELTDRLAKLEDMIEQNVLIKLPCKVGDTVYHIDRYWQSPTIEEYEVYGFTMNDKNELRILVAYGMFCMSKDEIFLTKAEAEAELAKIRGKNETN